MTSDAPNSSSPPPARLRTRLAWVWRAAAVAAILFSALVVADYFRSAGHGARPAGGPAGPVPDTAFLPTPPPAVEVPGDVPGRAAAEANLRRVMAGILMNAADDDLPYKDPQNKDPDERRRLLADFFGLPYRDLESNAPSDMVPPETEVLAVFDNPEGHGERMVLLRMKLGLGPAMSALYSKYTAGGWTAHDSMLAQRQTDEGWMVRFTKQGRERVVYARPRRTADETLVAVYDTPH